MREQSEYVLGRLAPDGEEELAVEVAARRSLQHVVLWEAPILAWRQATRLGGAERTEPELQNERIVLDVPGVFIGGVERQQRGHAAVLPVGLKSPLPRLVEGKQCRRAVVGHCEAHACIA